MNSAKVMQVIETKCARGNGTIENVFREVTQYWTLEGKLLAEYDPHPDNQANVRKQAEAFDGKLARHVSQTAMKA